MALYVILGNYTDKGIRNPKRHPAGSRQPDGPFKLREDGYWPTI